MKKVLRNLENEYKSYYTFIFSIFYLIEGLHQGLPYIFPYLLLEAQGGYDIAQIMLIASASSMPWTFKFIVGLFNDKFGSKKYGRRFPFILIGCVWCGIWWIINAINLPIFEYGTFEVYRQLLIYSIFTNIGFAVADTSLDGLILDVTPKEKLGRIESITWTMLMAGSALGGFIIAYLFLQFNILPLLFGLTGIFSIIVGILPKFIKEHVEEENVKISNDLKRLITDKENWKIYGYTFTESIANPIIFTIFAYFILISIGSIDVETTLLTLASGEGMSELFMDNIIIQIGNGIGVVLGCFFAGRIADKNRKKAINLGYFIYIPICLTAIFFKGLILGNIANGLFGFSYGVLSIAGQTIRGDIAKRRYSELKSTFFAILISLSNAGLAFGNLIGAYIFRVFALLFSNFDILTFSVLLFCLGTILISYMFFKLINPELYEFIKNIKKHNIIENIDNEKLEEISKNE